MQFLINHTGYSLKGPKYAIIQALSEPLSPVPVWLQSLQNRIQLEHDRFVQVPGWKGRWFANIDFSGVCQPGNYRLVTENAQSPEFQIRDESIFTAACLSDILHYFKSQRSGGIYDRHDRDCPIHGTNRTADVSGGWYDASGDVSKYLSHLSYTNYLNPQQTPMVVWNMLKVHGLLEGKEMVNDYTLGRIIEEAQHGADFLMRMQDPEGYFYMIVFDVWSKDVSQREICSYSTQQGIKSSQYQAGFRQGGGMAIAALAAAAQKGGSSHYSSEDYLQAAVKGYWHLKQHNRSYLNDGKENIIDAYCALLATVELYKATNRVDAKYLNEAREWAAVLADYRAESADHGRIWFADKDHTRPYFHAAEAGLPCIALTEYISAEDDTQNVSLYRDLLAKSILKEVKLARNPDNPFAYPQQVVQDLSGRRRLSYFVPHNNESGYWWQGENARLASLAAMATLANPFINEFNDVSSEQLQSYATSCLDWILGLNPFDACMLDGYGRNNPTYWPEAGYHNAKGGICNGITSGFVDEEDIAFKPHPQDTDPLQNWRWGEQWIPHAAWFLLAVVAGSTQFSDNQRK